MKIRDLSVGVARVKIEGLVTEKSEPRSVKLWDGRTARVADVELKDESGSITMSLWDDQIGMVNVGDRIMVVNGYVGSYRKEKRLSLGRYGKIVKI